MRSNKPARTIGLFGLLSISSNRVIRFYNTIFLKEIACGYNLYLQQVKILFQHTNLK